MAFGGAAKAVDVSSFNDVKQWVSATNGVHASNRTIVAKHIPTGHRHRSNPHLGDIQLCTCELDDVDGGGWTERIRW
jgi:hypothetical protein